MRGCCFNKQVAQLAGSVPVLLPGAHAPPPPPPRFNACVLGCGGKGFLGTSFSPRRETERSRLASGPPSSPRGRQNVQPGQRAPDLGGQRAPGPGRWGLPRSCPALASLPHPWDPAGRGRPGIARGSPTPPFPFASRETAINGGGDRDTALGRWVEAGPGLRGPAEQVPPRRKRGSSSPRRGWDGGRRWGEPQAAPHPRDRSPPPGSAAAAARGSAGGAERPAAAAEPFLSRFVQAGVDPHTHTQTPPRGAGAVLRPRAGIPPPSAGAARPALAGSHLATAGTAATAGPDRLPAGGGGGGSRVPASAGSHPTPPEPPPPAEAPGARPLPCPPPPGCKTRGAGGEKRPGRTRESEDSLIN